MLNIERLKEQLKFFIDDNKDEIDRITATKQGVVAWCGDVGCKDCVCYINGACKPLALIDYLASEYKEPYKLTRYEYETLKYAEQEGCEWIARDKDDSIYFFYLKPEKHEYKWLRGTYIETFRYLFNFVKWKDEKPTKIKDILNNYEIIEESENK